MDIERCSEELGFFFGFIYFVYSTAFRLVFLMILEEFIYICMYVPYLKPKPCFSKNRFGSLNVRIGFVGFGLRTCFFFDGYGYEYDGSGFVLMDSK